MFLNSDMPDSCSLNLGSFLKVNYVTFADPNEWMDEIGKLKDQCNGEGVGEVSEYELGA